LKPHCPSRPCLPSLTRRTFLVATGTTAAYGCSSPAASPVQVGPIPAGNVANLAVGTLQAIDSEPACIGRDSGGVYAMTLTCTHAGCDMGAQGILSPQRIFCGCHGSEFDGTGNVVRGPAFAPLDHFAVTVDAAGNLTVHTDQIVDPSQRLVV
jgi:Rieske Fe-S protein